MRYAAVAYDYYAEGWTPLPLPARQKFPPPKGYTGASAKQPSIEQYRCWCNADRAQYGNEVGAGYNVAVVMPDDVIALDIDKSEGHKVKADGLETLAGLADTLGPLPPTVVSSHGGNHVYGHRLYRVPKGLHFGALGPGIDTIQRTHRYICAPPSIHTSGEIYEWQSADTTPIHGVPTRDLIADLPASWLERMTTKPATHRGNTSPMPALFDTLHCKAVETMRQRWESDPLMGRSSRHDGYMALCYTLAGFEREGHIGAWATAMDVGQRFVELVTGDGRTSRSAEGEARRIQDEAWAGNGGQRDTTQLDPCRTYRARH
jgi:hypothetical protein